jgi:hypothetical protein
MKLTLACSRCSLPHRTFIPFDSYCSDNIRIFIASDGYGSEMIITMYNPIMFRSNIAFLCMMLILYMEFVL